VVLFPVSIVPGHPLHIRMNAEGVQKGVSLALELANTLGIELRLAAALDDNLLLPQPAAPTCIHPWLYAVVDYEGNMGFCDLLIGNDKYTINRKNGSTCKELLNSKEFQLVRQAHLERDLPEKYSACRWCYRMRYVDFEDQIIPELKERVVSNKTRLNLFEVSETNNPPSEFY
jgi:hypothetical protein